MVVQVAAAPVMGVAKVASAVVQTTARAASSVASSAAKGMANVSRGLMRGTTRMARSAGSRIARAPRANGVVSQARSMLQETPRSALRGPAALKERRSQFSAVRNAVKGPNRDKGATDNVIEMFVRNAKGEDVGMSR